MTRAINVNRREAVGGLEHGGREAVHGLEFGVYRPRRRREKIHLAPTLSTGIQTKTIHYFFVTFGIERTRDRQLTEVVSSCFPFAIEIITNSFTASSG